MRIEYNYKLDTAMRDIIAEAGKAKVLAERTYEIAKNDPTVSQTALNGLQSAYSKAAARIISVTADKDTYDAAYSQFKDGIRTAEELTELEQNLCTKYGVNLAKRHKMPRWLVRLAAVVALVSVMLSSCSFARNNPELFNNPDSTRPGYTDGVDPEGSKDESKQTDDPKPVPTPKSTIDPDTLKTAVGNAANSIINGAEAAINGLTTAAANVASVSANAAAADVESVGSSEMAGEAIAQGGENLADSAELPAQNTGLSIFNDAYDTDQVRNRVDWWFTNNIDPISETAVTAKELNREDFIRQVSLINGAVPFDSLGGFDYNSETDGIILANRIGAAINAMSFKGKDYRMIYFAPLFKDGSLGQMVAATLDAKFEAVLAAANHLEKQKPGTTEFCEALEAYKVAAGAWGDALIAMFYYIDFTGEEPSIYNVDPVSQVLPLCALFYGQHTVVMEECGIKYDADVCIKFCDEHGSGKEVEMPLSQVVKMLVFGPMVDTLAARSGDESINQYSETPWDFGYNMFGKYFDGEVQKLIRNYQVLGLKPGGAA